jgi:hypothetical protein
MKPTDLESPLPHDQEQVARATKLVSATAPECLPVSPIVPDTPYWLDIGGDVQRITAAEILERIRNGEDPATLELLNFDETGDWQNARERGFVKE